MAYKVSALQDVLDDLKKYSDNRLVRAFERKIAELANEPRPIGSLLLHGKKIKPHTYRIRVARKYRAVYQVDDPNATVTIIEIRAKGKSKILAP